MKEFQISRYVKKWLPLILAVCVLLTGAVYMFLASSQTYIASAVIRYEGENAARGQTPTGEKLNVEEIKSSAVVSKVISNLGLAQAGYSVDSIISGITITEVVDEDEQMRKEALLDEGQEYEYEPVTYIVSFTAGGKANEFFAREVLDEVLDVYFATYSETYVNNGYTVNSLRDLNQGNYDYIEMMELIDSNVDSTLEAFVRRTANGPNFRAASTGMTFSDLADRFYYLQSVDISRLFSKILQYQVTKDKELLIAKYRERINNNQINGSAEEEKIADVLALIDAYVAKMRESGNTNITYEYILDDVYGRDLIDKYGNVVGEGAQTVTYDKLIYSWRDHRQTEEYAVIDSAYCSYILNVFGRCLGVCQGLPMPSIGAETGAAPAASGETAPADPASDQAASGEVSTAEAAAAETAAVQEGEALCASSEKTCAAFDETTYAQVVSEIETGIDSLLAELEALYRITDATNAEYNEYMGASYISTLSSVSVEEGMNVALYTAIAAVFLLVICSCCAILLGRLNDIIQYVFYTDSLTGLNNRNAFDTYLKNSDKRVLDDGVVCAAVTIANQPVINRQFGREEGDRLIRFFAQTLGESMAKTGAYLVYNGKAQFIAVLEGTDRTAVEHMLQRFRFVLDRRDFLKDAEILYEVGIAESGGDGARKMRALLSKTMSSLKEYKSSTIQKTAG